MYTFSPEGLDDDVFSWVGLTAFVFLMGFELFKMGAGLAAHLTVVVAPSCCGISRVYFLRII